jgi:probable rRNA maturation factor
MKTPRILEIQNRQRTQSLDLQHLRAITRALLDQRVALPGYELGIHLVDAEEMAHLNETYLHHSGSTDVITFDHREPVTSPPAPGAPRAIHGELFISVPDAIAQAEEFNSHWTEEIVRYIVHGTLHLLGHDDLRPVARRHMKRAENKLVTSLRGEFPIADLAKKPRTQKPRNQTPRAKPTPRKAGAKQAPTRRAAPSATRRR